MKRLSSWALPIILGVAGVVLIIAGTLDLDEPTTPSLPPITTPRPSPVARTTPTPRPSPTVVASPTPTPTPEPMPSSVTAAQLEVPSVGINVLVRQSQDAQTDNFPPTDAAYILRAGNQPGRSTNAYLFAHALNSLFKPLWNVQIGAEVLIRMSDDSVLRYVVTEVRPNVACPDPNATQNNPQDPPLALQIHDTCDEGASWTAGTDHERLTLQTSQGFNRNWGEFVVVAEPVD
ncbi:MAG: sortase domain-containing protein [Candidatus Limnocylindria bacterium]